MMAAITHPTPGNVGHPPNGAGQLTALVWRRPSAASRRPSVPDRVQYIDFLAPPSRQCWRPPLRRRNGDRPVARNG